MVPKLKKPTDNSARCRNYSFIPAVKNEMQVSHCLQIKIRFAVKIVLLAVQ